MSKELEQAADDYSAKRVGGIILDDDVNAFKAGAEWQKKQDELTWQDVKEIVNIADSKLTHTAWDDINYPDEQKYYEEVLKEFNEQKHK